VSDQPTTRDPRRSLIIGSAIAAVVLAVLALIVLIGLFIVFYPRQAGRDSLGPAAPPAAAIHQVRGATS
jgi:hypothetical protein